MEQRAITTTGIAPVNGFQWRDQMGEWHDPAHMETRHLYFTLRMIWNHTMPPDAQLRPFREYALGPTYTREYLQKAVRALATELATRKDVAERWRMELLYMVEWLKREQIKHQPRGRAQ